jgi:RimJ/RimL family protein N-acetyltransferase
MKQQELRTRRLILRAMRYDDYAQWFDANINRPLPRNRWDPAPRSPDACTKAQYKKMVARFSKAAAADDSYWYGVFEKSSGNLVGAVDFDIFVRQSHQFANFGYQIEPLYRGLGYGQEAATAGLRIGFQQLRLNRLEAAINLDNRKSLRLAKAIGMRREGIKRRYWFEHGAWVDHVIYVANPEDIGLKARKPI